MRCSVWAVDFSAFFDFAVALATRFELRTTIAISRQHLLVTSLVLFVFKRSSKALLCVVF